MMHVVWRASQVVALLLASVGTASAECAWVLWSRELVLAKADLQKEWLSKGGWTDETMCQRAKEDAIRRGLTHPVAPGGKVER